VVRDFEIPDGWLKYRSFDYGLDLFACLWIAVDHTGRCYVYREFAESRLIVSDAARAAVGVTKEKIEYTVAPPDMWSTQKDTGKTMAQVFAENGLGLVRANNSRVQGWMALKELLKPRADGRPGLVVFESCRGLIDDLMAIQHDERNPSDCAVQPHEITHRPDALRYFAQLRTLKPELTADLEEDQPRKTGYEAFLVGGEVDEGYLRGWG